MEFVFYVNQKIVFLSSIIFFSAFYKNSMSGFWHVLYLKPRSEKKTAEALIEQDFRVYLPTQRVLRQWKDRKKWLEVPLLNGYAFVKITDKDKYKVLEHENVLRYVRIGNDYAQVSDAEIERIQLISRSLTEIKMIEKTPKTTNIGKKVRVIIGLLIGIEGEIVAEKNRTVLQIEIVGLGQYIQVEINSEEVELLQP